MRPVLFVTGNVPAYRAGALRALHEREGIELALFGGRSLHGGPAAESLEVPWTAAGPARLARLAASGRHRAVVVPTGGRAALLAAWAGARAGRRPLLLWASLWAHPRTPAHALSALPLRRLYRSADAVVTYGPHVSSYVRSRGAHNVHEAPQSVDNGFWASGPDCEAPAAGSEGGRPRFLYVGRADAGKGLEVLLAAWRGMAPGASLVLAGPGPGYEGLPGVRSLAPLSPRELRAQYACSDVLVIPSVRTRSFREPWGLVANEAMNRGLPVIASEEVGAAAGGLVQDGVTGVVVPAGDAPALRGAMARLAEDRQERSRLGAAGRERVASYTHEAWAAGFSAALGTVGLSRERW